MDEGADEKKEEDEEGRNGEGGDRHGKQKGAFQKPSPMGHSLIWIIILFGDSFG